MSAEGVAEGVYVTLEELTKLQYRAKGLSFLPRQPVHSLLSGRHASRIRGRGLDFEELRGYLPGDDPRTIDWKVTARTGKAHVRVFTEERDRPALLVVDQRISMFFGTRLMLKSVTAAQIAAAGAWRVTGQGDRVGAVVFDDESEESIRPHRSKQTVLRILHALVDRNQALRADTSTPPDPTMLNRVLDGVSRTVTHDYLIVIISDFDGADAETTRMVSRLARHNDVLAIPVYDPARTELPDRGRLVVSNGELQVEIDLGQGSTRQRMRDVAESRLASIMAWQPDLAVPVLPISTAEDVLEQARRLLGHAPRGPAR
ncbi:MAG: DUF58 domain-containing protein [Longimicrobiales bacterium]